MGQVRPRHRSVRAYVAYRAEDQGAGGDRDSRIFGLTDWEPTVADRLAKEGYVATRLTSRPSTARARPMPTAAEAHRWFEPERITADLTRPTAT
jgi:dienelactone hydrolase